MSTRSNIAIKIREKDLNKRLALKINNQDIDRFLVATEDTPYLQIYCHHDGYISYMGELLAKHCDYDEVLNIILHGDTSALHDDAGSLSTYAYAPDEGNFECDSNVPEVLARPSYDEEYLYVFEDGKWLCDDSEGLRDLDEILKNN